MALPELDPASLRAHVRRDWGATARLDPAWRAAQPVGVKVRIAIDLYEAARLTARGWPTAAGRGADLAHQLAVCAILRPASGAGAR